MNTKKRILVLDDDAMSCALISAYLHREDLLLDVSVVDKYVRAEERIKTEQWDIVCLDGELSEEILRYGFDLIPIIKHHQQNCKIVMISGSQEHLQRGKDMGADVLIKKPMSLKTFSNLVRNILGG